MIDVVILSLNRPQETVAAVGSALRQRGVQVSAWIVDQGSESATIAALREACSHLPDTTLVELGRNFGVAGGRNRGNALGRAELIVSLDDDAELESPDALARVAERFHSEAALGALGFRILVASTGEDDRLSWVYPRQLWSRREEGFLATRFCGAGHALRRTAWAKTRGYDERLFFYWEELDLAYQLIELGYCVAYDPRVRVLHKVSPIGRRSWTGERFYYLVRNALYLDWRYWRRSPRFAVLALGYLAKAARNRVLGQAWRAFPDLIRMIRTAPSIRPLGSAARRYIADHDSSYRGSWLSRFRNEALDRLPK